MEERDKHRENLEKQLERSRATYLMMREAGFDKAKAVRLKFAFYPGTAEGAAGLATYLAEKAGYDAEAAEADGAWIVRGQTKPVKISAATLGRWVHWMCKAGFRYECLFDGWGAKVSGKSAGDR